MKSYKKPSVAIISRELQQRRRRRQKELQKSSRLDKQNRNFVRAADFFLYISLPSLHDYGVKIFNFTFYGVRKQATTNFSFSFKTWVWSPRNPQVKSVIYEKELVYNESSLQRAHFDSPLALC